MSNKFNHTNIIGTDFGETEPYLVSVTLGPLLILSQLASNNTLPDLAEMEGSPHRGKHGLAHFGGFHKLESPSISVDWFNNV